MSRKEANDNILFVDKMHENTSDSDHEIKKDNKYSCELPSKIHGGVNPHMVIYIHIPFCERKCHYCFFPTITRFDNSYKEHYLSGIIRQIETFSRSLSEKKIIKSIYLGGGTPSLLGINRINAVIGKLRSCYDMAKNFEINIEINPSSIKRDDLQHLIDIGVNRYSFGVQSFSRDFFKIAGRPYPSDISELISFLPPNVRTNLDLIIGYPTISPEAVLDSVNKAISLSPNTLTIYPIAVKKGSALHRDVAEGDFEVPSWEVLSVLTSSAFMQVRSNGYERKTLWSFTRDGREHCLYEALAWQGIDVLALGVGAISRIGKSTWRNAGKVKMYINEPAGVMGVWDMDNTERLVHLLVSGLRMVEWNLTRQSIFSGFDADLILDALVKVRSFSQFNVSQGKLSWKKPSVYQYKENLCRELIEGLQPSFFTKYLWYLP